jgi:hypothetical protein
MTTSLRVNLEVGKKRKVVAAACDRQLGSERVITIPGSPHSPQRTHPEATTFAILRAVGAGSSSAGDDA